MIDLDIVQFGTILFNHEKKGMENFVSLALKVPIIK